MKNLYIFIVIYLSAHILPAQQSDLSNMYPLNYYLINGAATGTDSTWQIFTGYRRQWNGIANSPSLGYLGVSGLIGNNHGVGLLMEQSKYGLLSDVRAKLSYAYHFKLSPRNVLHAGVSLGFMNHNFETSKVIASDYTDELLRQNSLTGTDVHSDIGIMFTSQRLLIGASLPQIVRSNSTTSESNTGFPGYYILHGSYDVVSNEIWLLQAVAAYRKNESLKRQVDIGSRVLWKNKFGGGVGYRSLSGLFLRAEVNLRDLLGFAYSFEQGTSSTGKSQEVMVSIRFGKRKRDSHESANEISEPLTQAWPPDNGVAAAEPVATDTVTVKPEGEKAVAIANEVVEEKKPFNVDSINNIFEKERLIFFKLRSSDRILSENYETTVALVGQILEENTALKVSITGHSCALGSEDVNQKISTDRARRVFNDLKKRGISPARMQYAGKGESEPIDSGDSPEQLARNRRVQMTFSLIKE